MTLPALPTGTRASRTTITATSRTAAWVDAGTGQWRALACDGGVRFDPLPWRIAELSCLCAHGNASAAFADDRKALEATSGYNQRLLTRRTAISFSVAAALALLPSLLLLGRTGWRRLRRGAGAEPGAGFRAPQPRPHYQRRGRLSARPRALLAPRRSRECCARRERRRLGGGCASALPWGRRGGRYS